MQIRLLGSGVHQPDHRSFAQTFVINDMVAIDAGTLGFLSPVENQQRIQHVFLSHCHLDHICTLPLFLENVYEPSQSCPIVYAGQDTHDTLRQDFFNERIWPDLDRLAQLESPFYLAESIRSQEVIEVANLKIQPVELKHVVPTLAFVVSDHQASVAIVSDTLPSDLIWQILNETKNLKAIFLETAFPNEYQWLADKAGHLTPLTVQQELAKLKDFSGRVIAVHLKPMFHNVIAKELQELNDSRIEIGVPNQLYEIG